MAVSKFIQAVKDEARGRPRSTAWYRSKIKEFGDPRPQQLIRDGKRNNKPFYGKLNMFFYDPKFKKKLISRALEIEPDNVDLIFNLGVINADKGEFEKALGFYNKAIEMNPEYTKAYLNAAALILDKEGPMVEQMNFLMEKGKWNSYDKLKLERDDLYRSAIPFLEKVIALDNKSYSAAKTLRNIYSQLDNEELYEKYKFIVENLEKE